MNKKLISQVMRRGRISKAKAVQVLAVLEAARASSPALPPRLRSMSEKMISQVMGYLGSRTSKAKADAARKNGKLGGRPKGSKKS